MPPQIKRKFIGYVVMILILLVQLSCDISFSGQDGSVDSSTSSAQTIEAGNAQLTIQAQQVQLTAFAQTLSVPAVPTEIVISTQPEPIQPTQPPGTEPTPTSAVQSPAHVTEAAVNAILGNLGITASPELVFGPANGSLEHDPTDGSVSYECANQHMENFFLDVNFSPPYSSDGDTWDFGIIFRVGDKGSLRLMMMHDRKWEFENYSAASGEYITISKGELPYLSLNTSEENHIRLIASGKQGWFYIDDLEVGGLDLTRLTDPGSVCIALGFYKNTEKAGASTDYSDFTVWELN